MKLFLGPPGQAGSARHPLLSSCAFWLKHLYLPTTYVSFILIKNKDNNETEMDLSIITTAGPWKALANFSWYHGFIH